MLPTIPEKEWFNAGAWRYDDASPMHRIHWQGAIHFDKHDFKKVKNKNRK
jgi:hypothetical protein